MEPAVEVALPERIPMDRDTAIEFEKRIELAFKQMEEISAFLRSRLDASDFRTFADLWGGVICDLDLGILEVVYRAYPDLRPNGMRPVTPLGEACAVDLSPAGQDRDGPRPSDASEGGRSQSSPHDVLKTTIHPCGKRRVHIIQRADGLFSYQEEKLVMAYDADLAEALDDYRTCWIPITPGVSICASPEAAENAARGEIAWLAES